MTTFAFVMKIASLFNHLISLIYPPLCTGCAEALLGNERFFCSECLAALPETGYVSHRDNSAYERLMGRFPVEKVQSYLYYNKRGLGQRIVADIKYRGNGALGEWMGSRLAGDLLPSGFFSGIDFLVPVPLHRKKQRTRGFNQSEAIARGISKVTAIPLDTKMLYRAQANLSQTRKGIYERWKNTQGIFAVRDTELFAGKHLLLVDDVLTTGSTLEACAEALLQCKGSRISVLTLAIA